MDQNPQSALYKVYAKKSEKSDHRFTRYRDFKTERSDWPREGTNRAQIKFFTKFSQIAV